MESDWGSFLQNFNQNAGNVIDSTRNFNLQVAQTRFMSSLRQKEFELEQRRADLDAQGQEVANEANRLKYNSDKAILDAAVKLNKLRGTPVGMQVTQRVNQGVPATPRTIENEIGQTENQIRALAAPETLLRKEVNPADQYKNLVATEAMTRFGGLSPEEKKNVVFDIPMAAPATTRSEGERNRARYLDLYLKRQKGQLNERDQAEFGLLDRELGGKDDFSLLLDEYEGMLDKPMTDWTPKEKLRFRYIQGKITPASKKVDPLILQSRVVNLLRSKYGELQWANFNDDEAKLREINAAGQFYYPEVWQPMRNFSDLMAIDNTDSGAGAGDNPLFNTYEDAVDWILEHPEDADILDNPKIQNLPRGNR